MKTIVRLLIVASLFLSVTDARAEKVKMKDSKSRTLRGTTAGCTPSSTFASTPPEKSADNGKELPSLPLPPDTA